MLSDTPAISSVLSAFLVATGLLLAALALAATRAGLFDIAEWPPALMVGAIHVDILALREPIFGNFSVGTDGTFISVLILVHAVLLVAFINLGDSSQPSWRASSPAKVLITWSKNAAAFGAFGALFVLVKI